MCVKRALLESPDEAIYSVDSCDLGHLRDRVAEEDLQRQNRNQVHHEPRPQIVTSDLPSVVNESLSSVKVGGEEVEHCVD